MLIMIFISQTLCKYVYVSWQKYGTFEYRVLAPILLRVSIIMFCAPLLTFLNMKKYKFLNTCGSKSFRQRLGARVFSCTVLDTGLLSSYRLVQELKPLNTVLQFSFFKIYELILQYLIIIQFLCLVLYSQKSHGCYLK